MAAGDAETEDLIRRASDGDEAAVEELLARYRDRLRQMVAVRIDPRLLGRFDASDVVQEALVEASRKLPEYLQDQPLPFYPWLRQIAWERLVDARRRHVQARKRAVGRQQQQHTLPDRSTMALADRLIASGTSPSGKFARAELRDHMRAALNALPSRDREVLVLRHLEQLSTCEIASVMGMTEGAVKTRHVRALQRLRGLLNDRSPEQNS
ncbi:MAG: sigma-70 family RNA polymerase sigma factor [Phycisphaerales bacterium]|nr:MAG: sigma-70 family RNA polymerase sigma factor [Phycisphaerales bacterium]